jgi:tyrocidine synthetase-3
MRKGGNWDQEDRLVKKAVVAGQFIKEENYWKNKLAGEITKSFFPYDYKQDSTGKHNKEEYRFKLTGELFAKLMKLRNGADARLHMILAAGMVILLNKMTGNTDIIIGAPSLKQEVDIKFINTVLVLRHIIHDNMSFKELLLEVRKTIIEAAENQNFPIETLPYRLNMPISPKDAFPLFEIALLLKNIHDKRYIDHINLNLLFSFIRSDECIEGVVEFNSSLYNRVTIERIVCFYKQVFHTAFVDIGIRISEICILSEQERQKILFDFNNSDRLYPQSQTLKTPDSVALNGLERGTESGEQLQITYRQLNEKSNQLARRLRDKGVKADTLVGIMVESSIEMIIGILGILKAGGAYLPIDPGYPEKRKKYILTDGGVKLLLAQKRYIDRIEKDFDNYETIDFTLETGYTGMRENFASTCCAHNLAYGIYTSGTTGKPNGVLVEHRNIVNYACWRIEKFNYTENDSTCQMISLSFDAFGTNFYPGILTGGKIVLADNNRLLDGDYIRNLIKRERITNFSIVPPVYKLILENAGDRELETVRFVVLGGEKANDDLIALSRNIFPGIEIINEYGPTECTVASAAYRDVTPGKISIIGEPIFNTRLYILDGMSRLQPIGVAGELCIAGAGLARGYLNNPELTAEKFVSVTYISSKKMYKTGDSARWLTHGNIEFLGRIDQQVKIRGFRIELGEIESQLLNHAEIKDAVVLDRQDEQGQKYLCAYIVGVNGFSEMPDRIKLKEYLTDRLPDYMIPSSFVILDKIPLKTNGKVDRKALPQPEITAAEDYVAPRTGIEKRLVDIWADVLNINKEVISIHANFFEIGGHSLKATILTSKIHKEFNIQLPLAVLFEKPTVVGLSGYIKNSGPDEYTAVEPAEKKEYYKLSSPQKRLYILQQIDLDSTAYNIPETIYLDKDIDGDRLERTFRELIKRHESLRTSFEMINNEPVQKIYPDVPFAVEYYPLQAGGSPGAGEDAVGKIVARFVRPFDLEKAPLMRVGLINTGETGHVLILDMHHIITDGASMQVFVKDFTDLYQGEELPRLRIQYKDCAHWQNSEKEKAAIKVQEDYWARVFADGTPCLNLPLDYPRPQQQSFEGKSIDFQVGEQETGELKKIASAGEATLYMVLLALYTVMLAKVSGQEDIVVGTPTAGRRHADLENIIGMFVNTLPMRNHPRAEKTFNLFLDEVRESTLKAFENQDCQFQDIINRVMRTRDMNRNPLFDVMFSFQAYNASPEGTSPGPNPYEYENRVSRFDMSTAGLDAGEKLLFTFTYNTRLFQTETIRRFINYFTRILAGIIENPGKKIAAIQYITEEEKKQILVDFNNTEAPFPQGRATQHLWEEQAARTPDHVALAVQKGENISITYKELNRKTRQLSYVLRSKGVGPDTIAAIMVERSIEMIIGILGILKAGGAYLPIESNSPQERIDYMLADSNAGVLLSEVSELSKVGEGTEVIDLSSLIIESCDAEPTHLTHFTHPTHLCYIIYTSGSTGKPKGVMIEHRSVVNVVTWFARSYGLQPGIHVLQISNYTFDASVNQIFGTLLHGAVLHVIPGELVIDLEELRRYIEVNRIHLINFVPVVLNRLLSEGEKLENLQWVLSGGEKLENSIKDKILLKGYRLYNQYGPTETTIDALVCECLSEADVSLGQPIANVRCYILDKNSHLLPVGVSGEICVSGAGVARGYLNNPELTAEKFLFISYKKTYKTGDLGRWQADGTIEFLGRIDQQVKVRGYRIELEEVENMLTAVDEVKEAVVTAREDEGGSKYLCAYIVSEDKSAVPRIRGILSSRLPDYMIPAYFMHIGKIPLTPSGKIDHKALPPPRQDVEDDYTSPRFELENKLAGIWAGVLGRNKETIGIDSNFFQLGGHSLIITTMTARVHKELEVKVPMAQVFETPTIRGLSGYIKTVAGDKYTPVEPVEEREFYELSSAQKRMYLLQQFDPESTAYNMPQLISLEPGIKKEQLSQVFNRLIERHEILRTSFAMVDEKPVQRIHHEVEFKIEYCDLPTSFLRPFDLSRPPLLRVGLTHRHILLIDMHHIVSDGISQNILGKDFSALYKGEVLPPLRTQYKDFSRWQNSEKESKQLERQKVFWLEDFAREIPVLDLPYDYVRPVVQNFEGNTVDFEIGREETIRLKKMALKENVTLYMVLLSLYNILLSKLSSQEDIAVGTAVAGRRHADLYQIIGLFVNTLVLRNFPLAEKTFTGFLAKVKERTLEAFENQDYQFEDLVEQVTVRKDLSRNPLFDVMFAFDNIDIYNDKDPGPGTTKKTTRQEEAVQPSFAFAHEAGTAKFDLTFAGGEVEEKLAFSFQYASKLFKKETIQRWANYFNQIVSSILENDRVKISEIEIITGEEKRQILYDFNDTRADYTGAKTIHGLFAEQAAKTPDSVAVIGLERRSESLEQLQITYGELNQKSDQLTHLLREKGAGPDTIVGICVEPSIELIIGIMGILKAGGAYLPIDPEYPRDRIDYMLKDSNASLLLTGLELLDLCKGTACCVPTASPATCNRHLSLAYVIYTSGTTGRPKGVGVEHRQAVNTLLYRKEVYGMNTRHVSLQLFSFSFDGFVTSFFTPVISGAKVVLPGKEEIKDITVIKAMIARHGVTHFISIPGFYRAVLESPVSRDLTSLKVVTLAGDKLPPRLPGLSRERNRDIEIAHEYGVTEAAVLSTLYRHQEKDSRVKIGSPIGNAGIYILDRSGCVQPVGLPGEMCIGGAGVTRGYLNNPELTAEKFDQDEQKKDNEKFWEVQEPFFKRVPGRRRLYKTGDLARWLPDGNIEFLGRIDHQVKLRGFRIELGEIENQLVKHPGVREAIVLVKGMDGEDKFLCAYIITGEKNEVDNEKMKSELKEYLTRKLPDHMIPSYFTFIEQMPLTPSGKVDRKALPLPDVKGEGEYIGPGNKLEESLVEIWSEVLGMEKDNISINANFFELGGHSLKATQLISKIHKVLNVKIPLAEFFKSPTSRGLAQTIKRSMKVQYVSIEPAEEKEYYVLTPAQKRLYILQQMDFESTAYNIPHSIPLADEFDVERLEKAFIGLIKRHESLRTSFGLFNENEEPVQRVYKPEELEFSIDYYKIVEDRVEEIYENFVKPFDLSQAPLLRVVIIEIEREEKNTHLLLLDMHHIITDGTSQSRLEEEFMSLYSGETLAPLRLQYKDFSQWQNREEQQKLLMDQEKYWLSIFTDELPVLTLPTDYPRPLQKGFEGNTVDFILSEQQTRTLKDVAEKADATLYISILAVYTVLLHKLSGQEDIIVGTPIAARRHENLEPIIGMFVNTLAMRNYPTGDKTFDRYLREVKERTLEAFENQEYQFEDLVEKASVRRDTSRNPIFDVMLNLLNVSDYTGKIADIDEQEEYDYVHRRGTSKFDLDLAAVEIGTRVHLSLEFSTALFKPGTIERFIGYFKEILQVLSMELTIKLSRIDILTNKDKEQILEMSRGIESVPGESQTIHRLFEEQAGRTPEHVAAVYHDMKLTYKELNDRSNRLANLLIQKGVQSDSVVGLMLDRSLELITGLLAVLKAGGAYLPIDVAYPEERKRCMLEDSSVSLVLTNYDLEAQRSYIPGDIDVIDLDNADIYYTGDSTVPRPFTRGSELIYVIYTSGSTGQPKGVPLKHENLVNYVNWFSTESCLTGEDKSVLTSSFALDLGYTAIYPALLRGAQLHILPKEAYMVPENLLDYIYYQGISYLKISPSLFSPFVSSSRFSMETCRSLRLVVLGGEAINPMDVETAYRICQHLRIMNHYGPTEVTIGCIAQFIDRDKLEVYKTRPTIGRPIFNTKSYILDKYLNPLPVGVTGELYLSGAGVARGYLNHPELTAEKFILAHSSWLVADRKEKEGTAEFPMSCGLSAVSYIYMTGDLARWLPDGNMEFLGRIDHQVKIRGYRIELGEIENRLFKHSEIKEAAVLARMDEKQEKYLCAYIVSDKALNISVLRDYLSKDSPDYMIPSYFVALESLPLTPNGKVDRKALPEPEIATGESYVAPRDEVEEKLVEVWSEVLGIEKDMISIDANFFALGGHSLKATVAISRISKKFNVNVPLVELFKTPTIKSLAEYISTVEMGISAKINDDNLVLLKPGKGKANHLFMIHDGTGEIEGYMEFCKLLTSEFCYWGIRADRVENFAPRNCCIEDISQKYIEKIKKVQPHGPYYILGWSLGGIIAFETVRQLEQMNEEIRLLALVDSPPPHKKVWKRAGEFEFTLESEPDYIKDYSFGSEIREKLKNVTDLDQFWLSTVEYLETNNYDVEMVRRAIRQYGMQALPNYNRLNIRESIYYLNVGRTFHNARAMYTPPEKIHTPVHFFGATQTKGKYEKRWGKYFSKPIKSYKIEGDHYSIFKMPHVVPFVEKFVQIIKDLE